MFTDQSLSVATVVLNYCTFQIQHRDNTHRSGLSSALHDITQIKGFCSYHWGEDNTRTNRIKLQTVYFSPLSIGCSCSKSAWNIYIYTYKFGKTGWDTFWNTSQVAGHELCTVQNIFFYTQCIWTGNLGYQSFVIVMLLKYLFTYTSLLPGMERITSAWTERHTGKPRFPVSGL